jgi:hypothetical protein
MICSNTLTYNISDYEIMRCKRKCWAVATKKDKVLWDKPHYHCFGCENLFVRNRAQQHYSLHILQNPETQQHTHQLQQTHTLQSHVPHTIPHSRQATVQTQVHSQQSHANAQDIPQHTNRQNESTQEETVSMETDVCTFTTIHNIGPSQAPFHKQTTSRVTCPHCNLQLHPHSLKVIEII